MDYLSKYNRLFFSTYFDGIGTELPKGHKKDSSGFLRAPEIILSGVHHILCYLARTTHYIISCSPHTILSVAHHMYYLVRIAYYAMWCTHHTTSWCTPHTILSGAHHILCYLPKIIYLSEAHHTLYYLVHTTCTISWALHVLSAINYIIWCAPHTTS